MTMSSSSFKSGVGLCDEAIVGENERKVFVFMSESALRVRMLTLLYIHKDFWLVYEKMEMEK